MLTQKSLSSKIYSNLESEIIPEMVKINCTNENINDVKKKLKQQSDSIAKAVTEEIKENAQVLAKTEILALKTAVMGILDAFTAAPVVPMDGGASFKIGLMTMTASLKSVLNTITGNDKIT